MFTKLKVFFPYIIGMILISIFMFSPEIKGKSFSSHDINSVYINLQESFKFDNNILWTNRVFSGMPTLLVGGWGSPNFSGLIFSLFLKIDNLSFIYIYFITVLCIFLAIIQFGFSKSTSFIFSIAFVLNVWLLDSLYAGHPTKIMNTAFIALFISSLINFFNKGKWWNVLLIILSLNYSIIISHIQITYYGALVSILVGIYYFILYLKEKQLKSFFVKSVILILAVIIAVLPNISGLMNLNDFNKETMRGGKSEVTTNNNNSSSNEGGLDFDYAMSWSYTMPELVNFFIPNAMGGSSQYKISKKDSKLANMYNTTDDKVNIPSYWGTQPFTGAPNYIGVIVFFLFLYFLLNSKEKLKWLYATICLLFILFGLGKNFEAINSLVFKYLPLYNKFRTPTMAFSIINIIFIFGSAKVIKELLENNDSTLILKNLKRTLIAFAIISILGAMAISSGEYSSINDMEMLKQQNDFPIEVLKEDRANMFKSDFFRSIILVLVFSSLVYFYTKKNLSKKIFIISSGILIIGELFFVGLRYKPENLYIDREDFKNIVPEQPYDIELKKDNSHFRIFNTTNGSTFNDNSDGFRYSNIGGYSPAKLFRYQDIINIHLAKGNMNVLNMLNTKYFIVDKEGVRIAEKNTNACGNAWFVQNVKFANNANVEIDSIGITNPSKIAWVDKRYKNDINFTTSTDSTSSISLTKYHPDNMEYKSTSSTGGYVVFSEIWYKGNEDWKIYIDGKEEKMVRTNYLLRGAFIPKGVHEVVMKFKPLVLNKYYNISVIFTILLIIMCLITVYLAVKFDTIENSTKK